MKIGIRTFNGLQNGKVLIETDTENDIQALQNQIRDKCGDRLETNVQKRRNPRLIIYTVPEETTLENAAGIICDQNPELAVTREDITAKFIFKNKRNVKNLVIESTIETYRIMRQKKLKIGWVICHTEDYIYR
jgi:preprotein translocase subunit SecD